MEKRTFDSIVSAMVASVEGDGNHILKFEGNYSFRLNRDIGGQFIHIFKHAQTSD